MDAVQLSAQCHCGSPPPPPASLPAISQCVSAVSATVEVLVHWGVRGVFLHSAAFGVPLDSDCISLSVWWTVPLPLNPVCWILQCVFGRDLEVRLGIM